MSSYYNDNDKHCVAWLKELIASGLIPPGDVDNRSITDVKASELKGYNQCHFFAGIGGWPYALELAGWHPDRHVWTGSCPCQPLSVAGVRQGELDERHLWPHFARLIRDGDPPVVFGEQVASKDGREWLSGVRSDLEAMGYAVGAGIIAANIIGAHHERKRLYWVADSMCQGWKGYQHNNSAFSGKKEAQPINSDSFIRARNIMEGNTTGLLLDDGLSIGMARSAVKGYGNAIVPQVAAEFVKAFMETEGINGL